MNKLQDDMIDLEIIERARAGLKRMRAKRDDDAMVERIIKRTARMTQPEPRQRFDVWPWVAAAVIVGLVIYALSYDIAAHVVQEVGL